MNRVFVCFATVSVILTLRAETHVRYTDIVCWIAVAAGRGRPVDPTKHVGHATGGMLVKNPHRPESRTGRDADNANIVIKRRDNSGDVCSVEQWVVESVISRTVYTARHGSVW